MITDVVKIIKDAELGIISDCPRWIIKLWLYYRLYWLKSDVLMTRYDGKYLMGFILYNTINREIVIVAVAEGFKGMGYGSELVQRCPDNTIVVHRKLHRSYNFFRKNGFKAIINLNPKQVLSVKR